jgi:hypothetical protein
MQPGCEAEYPDNEGDKQMTDKKPFITIDEYISTFPADIQVFLEKVMRLPGIFVNLNILMAESVE